ncbi:MAG: outer membrane beta-barrel protein [Pseudomonadota bacterium]
MRLSQATWASLALSLLSPLAFASDEGVYLGANGVYGQIKLEDTKVAGTTYTPGSGDTFGGGLTAGINTSKHFAIEAAFDGLNKVDYDGEKAPSSNFWFTYVAAKPMIDFWKFNAFVELGAAYVAFTQNNNNPDVDDTDGSQVTPFFGAGLGFNFTPNFEVDLSVNRIQDTATPITFGMLTFTYHFVTKYEDSGFLAD